MGAIITWVVTSLRESKNRRHQFRCVMVCLKSDLERLPDADQIGGGPVQDFFVASERTVRLEGAKTSFDIQKCRRSQFLAACAEYYEMEDRAAKTATKILLHGLSHDSDIPYDGAVDPRTKRQQMLDALQKIIGYAE